MPSKSGHNSAGVAADQLKSVVDRIERLEEEKRALAEDIKEVYGEAKGNGFEPKIIRKIVAERRRSREEVDEEAALLEIYRAALGMLGDTPLGKSAIDRLMKPYEPRPSILDDVKPEDESSEPTEPDAPPVSQDEARAQGREAAAAGQPVSANPFAPLSGARAAWDEGWCQGSGSDGMDVPEAWRRKPKEKKPADDKSAGTPK